MAVLIDSYNSGGTYGHMFSGQMRAAGQPFLNTENIVLDSCKFLTNKAGTPPGNITGRLYEHTGTYGVSSKGTGTALAISDSIAAADVVSYGLTEFTFSGVNRYELQPSTYYVIVIYYDGISGSDSSNKVLVASDQTYKTHDGNFTYISDSSGNWVSSDWDGIFYVYGSLTGAVIGNKYPLPAFKNS